MKLFEILTFIGMSLFIFSCSVNNEGDIVPQSQKGIKQKETPLPEAKQITSSNALTYSLHKYDYNVGNMHYQIIQNSHGSCVVINVTKDSLECLQLNNKE